MSAWGSISTEMGFPSDVRFTPDSDRTADIPDWPLRANRRHAVKEAGPGSASIRTTAFSVAKIRHSFIYPHSGPSNEKPFQSSFVPTTVVPQQTSSAFTVVGRQVSSSCLPLAMPATLSQC